MDPPGNALDVVPFDGVFLEKDDDGIKERAGEEVVGWEGEGLSYWGSGADFERFAASWHMSGIGHGERRVWGNVGRGKHDAVTGFLRGGIHPGEMPSRGINQ